LTLVNDFAYRQACVGHEQGAGGGVEGFLEKPISAGSLLNAVLNTPSGAA
jgi:hypothetical protein